MPHKAKVPCQHPWCPALVPVGQKYCEKHKPLHPEETRPAAERGYDRKWQKARIRFLAEHPLCAECLRQGRYVPATDVDHIQPPRGDRTLFWDKSNWQALCHSCHSKKTAREDAHPTYRY